MPQRRGFTLLELVVAATLIVSGLVAIGRLTVASGRMWQQTRHQQIALEEMCNHLDRLLALPPQQLSAALDELTPSAIAVATLPEARLVAQASRDADGQRIDIEIRWGHPPQDNSLSLAGWLDLSANEQRESAEGDIDGPVREVPVREEAVEQDTTVEQTEPEESR